MTRSKKGLNTNIWTDINIQRYLALYLKRPVLWDEMRCDFNKPSSKATAYESIAKGLDLYGVDARECKKLFGKLKTLYEHRHQRPDDVKPEWYHLMSEILKGISCTQGRERCLCKGHRNCSLHCARRPDSACSFYRDYRKCEKCCGKLNMSSCPGAPTSRESIGLRVKREMCEYCCGVQGIGPPCADFYASSSEISCDGDKCDKQEIESKNECEIVEISPSRVLEYLRVAVIKLDKEPMDKESSCGSSCDCQDGNSVKWIGDLCGKDFLTPIVEDCSDEPCIPESCPCNDDDDKDDDDDIKYDARAGPFMDSARRRGKPISLLPYAEYAGQVIKPRCAARATNQLARDYPLQLDV